MIGFKARTRDDTKRVADKAKAGSFKSLGHAGAYIRKVASRSIRKRKTTSKPGSPPHSQTGILRRSMKYDVHRDKTGVEIGPTNPFGGKLWDLHEFGGVRRVSRQKLKAKRHRVGEFGPIRKGRMDKRKTRSGREIKTRYGDQYQRVLLKTKAQATRADRLVAEENAKREAEAEKKGRYAARPFMGPALAVARPQVPKFWRNSVA